MENYTEINGVVQSKSFAEMFREYQEFRDIHQQGIEPNLSLQQQHLLDFEGAMDEYGKYFSSVPDKSEDYFKMKEEAYAALGDPKGALARGTAWWFENVNNPYYDQLNVLWDTLHSLNVRDRAPVYAEIRHLSDSYNHEWSNADHPEWGTDFPSPEMYVFSRLSPNLQERQITEWANLPATFLTEFQREQVGYDIPEGKQEDASRLVDLVTRGDAKLKKALVQAGISPADGRAVDVREALDTFYAQRAEKLGVSDFWQQANAPEYQRIDNALGLSAQSDTWASVAGLADRLITAIQRADYSPSGEAQAVIPLYVYMRDEVAAKRNNDPAFDQIMDRLAVALGGESDALSDDDLVMTLFFSDFDLGDNFYLDE